MESKRTYECKNCANKGTPICKLCDSIVSPSGKVMHRPTQYTEYEAVDLFEAPPYMPYDMEQDGVAFLLIQTLRRRMPLPLSVVMDYNKQAEVYVLRRREEAEKKE